jgi:hypothetical protein
MTTHLLQVFDNPLDPEIQPVSFASEDVNGDLSVTRDLSVGRDAAITRNVQVNGNAAVVGALQATTFGVGAIANPRGTRAAIPDLPAFTDPPTAGEMATLRTTINTLLSYLRVTPGNGMIED